MSQLDLHANPLAWRSFVSVLLFVVFWEIAARSHVAPAILLPPFSVVAEQLWHSTLDGTLVADLSLSLGRAICGCCSPHGRCNLGTAHGSKPRDRVVG